jgi:hypothetical protein
MAYPGMERCRAYSGRHWQIETRHRRGEGREVKDKSDPMLPYHCYGLDTFRHEYEALARVDSDGIWYKREEVDAEIERLRARVTELEAALLDAQKEAAHQTDMACQADIICSRIATRVAELEADAERWCAFAVEALEDVDYWGGQASEYLQEKHDLKGTIARMRAAIDAARGEK